MPVPIWLVAFPREQLANLRTAAATAGLAGIVVNAPLIEPDFGTFLAQVGTCVLPFHVRMPMLPAPPGLTPVKIGQNSVLACWDPANMAAWMDHVSMLLANIDENGLAARFDGVRFAPQTAYPYDDEDGLQLNIPDHGTADLTAANFVPADYVQAHASGASFLNAEPLMAGKLLSWAPYTPGDQPRFDLATGQPGPNKGDPFAIPNAVMDAIRANYTAGPTAFDYTTFDGSALGDFQQAAASAMGGLILQTKTGLTRDRFSAALAAADLLGAMRVEIHVDQAGWV